ANALAVRPEAGAVEVEQSDLDGRLLVSLRAPAPVCVLVEASDARAPELGQPGAVVEVRAAPGPVERLAVDAAPADATRLADAERVVAVGLGLGSADALPAVERLARALDAEIAGSMPAATAGWVPHERYVGLSGQQISPALYLALGISGAPQHLAGIRGAKMVVAVDTDARAPIFRAAEYGIVGDLREVVPALTEALAASGG
ncbi:MAG: electron transfer flavoprotein subunit alpha/FixB family protein, partial [Bifidobacteriaceae bacterium]|nr:electron transfer flavoprotein subunit alpha/FixB family protein [Bifidobacteriaceae bacterium]